MCCFENCQSGNKLNNAGGNIMWYSNSGATFNCCHIFRCSDDENPGDSSIVSYTSKLSETNEVNFTRNYGWNKASSGLYGNCALEIEQNGAGNFKYSTVADSKGYRVMCFNRNSNSLLYHSNIVNCSVYTFHGHPLKIRDCCIFCNQVQETIEIDAAGCLSDDL